MPKFLINKLGRDKYKEMVEENGMVTKIKILNGTNLCHALKNKLIEEATEVKDAQSIEDIMVELADVLEVIDGICKAYDINKNDLKRVKEAKRKERGGFEKGHFFEYVRMDENNSQISYFRASPNRYPEE